MSIQDGESTSLSLPQWGFDDGAGCAVESGVFTLVAEVPELGLATSRLVEYHSSEVNPKNRSVEVAPIPILTA